MAIWVLSKFNTIARVDNTRKKVIAFHVAEFPSKEELRVKLGTINEFVRANGIFGYAVKAKTVTQDTLVKAVKDGLKLEGATVRCAYGKYYIDMSHDELDLTDMKKEQQRLSFRENVLATRVLGKASIGSTLYTFRLVASLSLMDTNFSTRNKDSDKCFFQGANSATIEISQGMPIEAFGSNITVDDTCIEIDDRKMQQCYTDDNIMALMKLKEVQDIQGVKHPGVATYGKSFLDQNRELDVVDGRQLPHGCDALRQSIVELADSLLDTAQKGINLVATRIGDKDWMKVTDRKALAYDEQMVAAILVLGDFWPILHFGVDFNDADTVTDVNGYNFWLTYINYAKPDIEAFGIKLYHNYTHAYHKYGFGNFIMVYKGYALAEIRITLRSENKYSSGSKYTILPIGNVDFQEVSGNTLAVSNGQQFALGDFKLRGLVCGNGKISELENMISRIENFNRFFDTLETREDYKRNYFLHKAPVMCAPMPDTGLATGRNLSMIDIDIKECLDDMRVWNIETLRSIISDEKGRVIRNTAEERIYNRITLRGETVFVTFEISNEHERFMFIMDDNMRYASAVIDDFAYNATAISLKDNIAVAACDVRKDTREYKITNSRILSGKIDEMDLNRPVKYVAYQLRQFISDTIRSARLVTFDSSSVAGKKMYGVQLDEKQFNELDDLQKRMVLLFFSFLGFSSAH